VREQIAQAGRAKGVEVSHAGRRSRTDELPETEDVDQEQERW